MQVADRRTTSRGLGGQRISRTLDLTFLSRWSHDQPSDAVVGLLGCTKYAENVPVEGREVRGTSA